MASIAALISIFVIICLFWMERKKESGVSGATWLPFVWIFFVGSRRLSQWLSLDAPMRASSMQLEGNPLNTGVFSILIVAGMLVLWRRRLDWRRLFTQNIWIWLFFIFGAISILWSDYQIVAFKRLIKSFGTVIMAMIILSEECPYKALGVILRRLAFLFLPLSVLFIKYYPHLGIVFTRMGKAMYMGITVNKNSLGQFCLILGIYFCWSLLFDRREGVKPVSRWDLYLYLISFPVLAWLLYMADSVTSLVSLSIAICIFLFARLPLVYRKPKRLLVIGITIIAIFVIMWLFLGDEIRRSVIALLGRKKTLTGRTIMWEYLKSHAGNHWVGVGYENFWLGDRLEEFWERFRQPSYQAHNGYLEIYLNLGLIGLALIVCNIISGLVKTCKYLFADFSVGILRLSFIVIVVIYNYTEATFFGVSNMFLIFWLGVINPPLKSSSEVFEHEGSNS
jgi:O-antigen ligase